MLKDTTLYSFYFFLSIFKKQKREGERKDGPGANGNQKGDTWLGKKAMPGWEPDRRNKKKRIKNCRLPGSIRGPYDLQSYALPIELSRLVHLHALQSECRS